MPGFDWNTGSGDVDNPSVYSVQYTLDYHDVKPDGSFGEKVGEGSAADLYVYTDVPGDNKFILENSFKLSPQGVGGKLFSGREYNFYYSAASIPRNELESKLTEKDCQKVNTGKPSGGKLQVKLKGKVVKGRLNKDAPTKVGPGEVVKIYKPVKRAGRMRLLCSDNAATVEVFHPDLKTPYKAKDRDDKANPTGEEKPVKGGSELGFDIKKDDYKWFYVRVSKPCDLTATFYTEAIPREKDGAPLFPWHFYYWPVNKTTAWEGNDSLFAKFGRAFTPDKVDHPRWWEAGGKDAVADGVAKGHAEVVKKAADKVYERADLGHSRPSQPGWAGHCHNSAPSSMLFKDVKATNHNGENFSIADLQLLVAEVTGNYAQFKGGGWGLKPKYVYVNVKYVYGDFENSNAKKLNLMSVLKPGEQNPAAGLKDALKDKYHRDQMYNGKKFVQMTDPQCQEEADRIIKAHGGAEAFNNSVKELWNEIGPDFVANIYRMMADDQDPCMGDIRSNQAAAGPAAIWNNCAMYVRTNYSQPEDKDEKNLETENIFYFNIDNANVLGEENCVVNSEGEIEVKKWWGRTMKMEETYSDAGAATKSVVKSFTAQGNGWDEGEVYMITYLSRVKGMAAERKKADGDDDFGLGNFYVTHDFVKTGVVAVREKFA